MSLQKWEQYGKEVGGVLVQSKERGLVGITYSVVGRIIDEWNRLVVIGVYLCGYLILVL